MPQPSYPFANIRIKVREKSLLSREKILRLAGAATAQEAMSLLADYGYPGAEDTKPSSLKSAFPPSCAMSIALSGRSPRSPR